MLTYGCASRLRKHVCVLVVCAQMFVCVRVYVCGVCAYMYVCICIYICDLFALEVCLVTGLTELTLATGRYVIR
jgi:hypothetical protein